MSSSFVAAQKGSLTFVPRAQSNYIPKIMIVDMNSFFATVEQQANPALRNKPVGIVASMHPSSVLIAASKECKAKGIKTGTLIKFAKQICPDLVLLRAEPEKYRQVNRNFNRILADYTDRIEKYSIDESFLDFRGSKLNPLVVGAEIKQRIKDEVGEWITCSVGIGDNKFLAKLACDLKKPDGLSVVWRENLPEVYERMKFSDLWGLSRGWTSRLARLNISGPRQLLNYPVQNLISIYGKPGYYIWRRVNGLEDDWVESAEEEEESAQKSFGHSWVLNFRTTDKARLSPVILRLAEKAARRMRRDNYWAYGFYLGARCTGYEEGFYHQKKLKQPIHRGYELYEHAKLLWKDWQPKSNVSQIAVGFIELKEKFDQLALFKSQDETLIDTIDRINDKYGEFVVRHGVLTDTSSWAPDAIAFGH